MSLKQISCFLVCCLILVYICYQLIFILPLVAILVYISRKVCTDDGYTSVVDMILCPKYKIHDPSKSAVLITGTSRGLGKLFAEDLMKEGFTVFGTVRKEKDR